LRLIKASIALPALALAMLALTVTPAETWNPPADDALYKGFDANLIYTSTGRNGSVQVTPSSIVMTAEPQSSPTANLFTTPLKKARASLDVSVNSENATGELFRVGIWSPWTGSGQFLAFGPPPQNEIAAETIQKGSPGPTLVGGEVNRLVLGHYQAGTLYHLTFDLDKAQGLISTSVTSVDGTSGSAILSSSESPAIFGTVQLSLTASASPVSGTSRIVLSNYSLTLPHQRAWASKVADPRATALLVVLAIGGLLAIVAAAVLRRRRLTQSAFRLKTLVKPWVLVALGVYLAGNALLFPLGAHPFDMSDERLYAYISKVYGTTHLFFLPNAVSLAAVWSGIPYGEFAFPYEPVTAYLSTATGWLNSLLFAGGGTFRVDSVRLEYLIKAINVLFGLADSVLIYLILRLLGATERWSLITAALFLFNPAVWFSMSIWGQTHVISLCFVLAAVYFAERGLPSWAWLALAAGCLTRPQMLVFGLLLGIVFLRKFPWQDNVRALSWTVIVVFVAIAPLTQATSPSLPIDIMLHNFNVQGAGGNNPKLTTVSQGAYSIWPLVTYITHGTSSTERAFTPSAETLIGSVTYQRAGQILTLAALLLVSVALWTRRQTRDEPGSYLAFVAVGITSFLMLLTGIVSTHFLLALPFLLICRRSMNPIAFWFVVVVWTIGTLVPMYGDMGVAISGRAYPLLSPQNNPVTHFVVNLYTWDRFITVAIVANICAVIWLAALAIRPPRVRAVVQPISI
jgi:hypothetical protein